MKQIYIVMRAISFDSMPVRAYEDEADAERYVSNAGQEKPHLTITPIELVKRGTK
jgi:hypothetical protein